MSSFPSTVFVELLVCFGIAFELLECLNMPIRLFFAIGLLEYRLLGKKRGKLSYYQITDSKPKPLDITYINKSSYCLTFPVPVLFVKDVLVESIFLAIGLSE
jgi:hypothetical protein